MRELPEELRSQIVRERKWILIGIGCMAALNLMSALAGEVRWTTLLALGLFLLMPAVEPFDRPRRLRLYRDYGISRVDWPALGVSWRKALLLAIGASVLVVGGALVLVLASNPRPQRSWFLLLA